MDTMIIKGIWNETAGKFKQKFARLTYNDLLYQKGKGDEKLGKVQTKLGKIKKKVHKQVWK